MSNWECFFNEGKEFEKFCADLIKKLFENVDIQVNDSHDISGSDGGKDIILYKNINNKKTNIAIVECKSRTSKSSSALTIPNLFKPIFCVMNNEVDKLVYITNFKFNPHTLDQFERINKSNNWPFSVTWIDGEELLQITKKFPEVYEKHCKEFPIDFEIDNTSVTDIVSFIESSNSNEVLLLKNLDLEEKTFDVFINNTMQICTLKPMSCNRLSIPNNIKNIDVKLIHNNFLVKENNFSKNKFFIPIDYIYVDPFKNLENIINNSSSVIYVEGVAGSGKSRLLSEIYQHYDNLSIKIDLSFNDYVYNFYEYIIENLFSISYYDINDIPDEIIQQYFKSNGIEEKEIEDFISLMKSKSHLKQQSNYETKINLLAKITMKLFQDKVLIVDNIHNFTPIDILLLQKLINYNISTKIIISARNTEIKSTDLEVYLNLLSKKIQVVTLKSNPKKLLEAFIDEVAENETTKTFLYKHTLTSNVQEFMLFLKKLKIQEVLTQNIQGNIIISINDDISKFDYKELFKIVVENLRMKIEHSDIENVIQTASIYGYTFPYEYLIDKYGEQIEEVVDKLIYYEIFKESDYKSNNKQWLVFDHELTQEYAYQSLDQGSRRLLKEHKEIAYYIKNDADYVQGKSDGRLGHHYEKSNQYEQALNSYFGNSEYLWNRGQLKEATISMEKAYSMTSYMNETNKLLIKIAEIIDRHISMHYEIGSSKKLIEKKLSALHIHIVEQEKILPKKYIVKEKYYQFLFKEVTERYIKDLKSIINDFVALKEHREEIEARILLCNKLKNMAKFEFAEKEGITAINKAKRYDNCKDLLADAYLDYGAVFLESNRFKDVIEWWDKAVNELKGTEYIGKLCYAMTDRAYIYALVLPKNNKTKEYLELSIYFSKKYHLNREECRSTINYINWLYYNTKYSKKDLREYLVRLEELLSELDDEYFNILVAFTKVNFTDIVEKNEYNSSLKIIKNYINVNSDTFSEGDQRERNILCWFKKHVNKKLEIDNKLDFCNDTTNLYRMKSDKYAVYY